MLRFLAILVLLSNAAHGQVFDYATGTKMALASERPMVVFVEQDGCQPCHLLWQTLSTMQEGGDFAKCVFVRVNLSRQPELTAKLVVKSTPVIDCYHYRDGKWQPSTRLSGNVSASVVRTMVRKYTHRAVTTVQQQVSYERPSSVPYGGRMYSHAVCNDPNCGMCWGSRGIGTMLRQAQPVTHNVSTTHLVPLAFRDLPELSPQQIKIAGQQPMPDGAVRACLDLLSIGPGDTLWDIGSGDGRVIVAAALRGATAVGIEIDGEQVERSERAIDFAGVGQMVHVIHEDALKTDLGAVKLAVVYLPPNVTEDVISRLPSGCRVVSYLHEIPGGTRHDSGGYTFFELTK